MKDTMAKAGGTAHPQKLPDPERHRAGLRERRPGETRGNARGTATASTPTLHEGRVVCTGGGGKTSGSYRFEAHNPESITGELGPDYGATARRRWT